MSSIDVPGLVQCNLGIFDSFRLLSIKKGRCTPKNFVRRHMLLVRPRYDAVITAGEGRVCFWMNLSQVN